MGPKGSYVAQKKNNNKAKFEIWDHYHNLKNY